MEIYASYKSLSMATLICHSVLHDNNSRGSLIVQGDVASPVGAGRKSGMAE